MNAGAGWFLVVAGCAFVLAGLFQIALAVAQTWITIFERTPATDEKAPTAGAPLRPRVLGLEGVAQVVDSLAKLPSFALAPFVGIILIAVGQRLLAGELLLRY